MRRQVELEKNDARLGFAEAQITAPANWATQKSVRWRREIEKVTGKKVRARYSQDATFSAERWSSMGSTIYDGSVKGQLEKIRESLSC